MTGEPTESEMAVWEVVLPSNTCFGLLGRPMCFNTHKNALLCSECWKILKGEGNNDSFKAPTRMKPAAIRGRKSLGFGRVFDV